MVSASAAVELPVLRCSWPRGFLCPRRQRPCQHRVVREVLARSISRSSIGPSPRISPVTALGSLRFYEHGWPIGRRVNLHLKYQRDRTTLRLDVFSGSRNLQRHWRLCLVTRRPGSCPALTRKQSRQAFRRPSPNYYLWLVMSNTSPVLFKLSGKT